VREFRRQVRLALEEHHMLPGDPNRVFRTFEEEAAPAGENAARTATVEEKPAQDPTTIKAHETNPFTGE